MRIQPLKKKLNQIESKAAREAHLDHIFHGEGVYVYRNKSNGDLTLPKAANVVRLQGRALNNKKVVPAGGEWEGDNYFMHLVPREASVVRVITSPQEEREKMLQEQKLILDQPDKVTREGTVEHVVTDLEEKKKPLHETDATQSKQDVLLTEDPMDGVQILRG